METCTGKNSHVDRNGVNGSIRTMRLDNFAQMYAMFLQINRIVEAYWLNEINLGALIYMVFSSRSLTKSHSLQWVWAWVLCVHTHTGTRLISHKMTSLMERARENHPRKRGLLNINWINFRRNSIEASTVEKGDKSCWWPIFYTCDA